MDTLKTLADVGLDDKETKVYLALLELGTSTVQPIAKKAGVIRPNCYPILDALIGKGLVSYFEKNNRRRYVAEDPQVLLRMMKQRWEGINELLPELRSIYNLSPIKPKVRFYEGREGIIAAYEELVQEKWYNNISSPDAFVPVNAEYGIELGRRIAEKGIRARELLIMPEEAPKYLKFYKKPLQQVRYLPKDTPHTTDMNICENKVFFISFDRDLHVIVIEGSGIIKTLNMMFEYVWNSTPEVADYTKLPQST